MATKASLIDKIRQALTLNPVKTTRAEHEKFLHSDTVSVVNELYATEYESTNTVPNKIVAVDTSVQSYNLRFSKNGNRATISGYGRMGGNAQFLFKILDTEFYPQTPVLAYSCVAKGFGSETMRFTFSPFGGSDPIIMADGTLFNGEYFYFSLTYKTVD